MTIFAVKEIPKVNRQKPHNDIREILNDFIDRREKCIVIIPGENEYASIESFYRTIYGSVHRFGLENKLKVVKRGDRVYVSKIKSK